MNEQKQNDQQALSARAVIVYAVAVLVSAAACLAGVIVLWWPK